MRRTNREGDEYPTSQVAFLTDLIADICENHEDYASHRQPDTATASDTIFPTDSYADYESDYEQMPNGVFLAYETIIIRPRRLLERRSGRTRHCDATHYPAEFTSM